MDIKVFIPTHSSSLNQPPQNILCTTCRKNENDDKADYQLQLFVHRERAMWNFFQPILQWNENESVSKALILVLLRNFNIPYQQLYKVMMADDCCSKNNDHIGGDCNDLPFNLWAECTFYFKSDKFGRGAKNTSISLAIIPPMTPFVTNKYALQPERIFSSSLVRLENLQIQLQSLNAYIATLGGGYFLCHYLSTAVCLARYQRQIAIQLNDIELAMKCTINEAYNYIHAGKIKKALKLIEDTKEWAKSRIKKRSTLLKVDEEKDIIISMCNAARWFAEQVQNEMDSSMNSQDEQQNGKYQSMFSNQKESLVSTTHDDFQRIRVVRVRQVSHNIKIL